MLNKKIIFYILIFYALCIVILCILPLNTKSELNHFNIIGFRADHFFHSLMFTPFLPMMWFGNMDGGNKKRLFLLIGLGFLFAISTETLQLFIPYRSFTFNDVMANCIGVALGAFVFIIKRK